jgi:hypothetical protein
MIGKNRRRRVLQLETSTLMLLFFLALLTVSIWKIYAFLPNKQLADDDTTPQSQEELITLMLETICKNGATLDSQKLFTLMLLHEDFDKQRFWRFNQNRLNRLLETYYLRHPHLSSIEDIYNSLR